MKKSKCFELSKIKPNQFSLNKWNELKVREYFCSNFMHLINVLLLREVDNIQNKTRNAMILAFCMKTGTLIDWNNSFPF